MHVRASYYAERISRFTGKASLPRRAPIDFLSEKWYWYTRESQSIPIPLRGSAVRRTTPTMIRTSAARCCAPSCAYITCTYTLGVPELSCFLPSTDKVQAMKNDRYRGEVETKLKNPTAHWRLSLTFVCFMQHLIYIINNQFFILLLNYFPVNFTSHLLSDYRKTNVLLNN